MKAVLSSEAGSPITKETIKAVKEALSAARMSTYEIATKPAGEEDPSALKLYAWNAQVSAALLAPLHICEVVMRNAVSDALESVYGAKWPWSPGFERSLPLGRPGDYCPRKDLASARRKARTTGKLIPELKFVFWQKLLTSRYDTRLWDAHLKRILPNLDSTKSVSAVRQEIYADLEQIRKLRNRIAHHEPIFTRGLTNDLQRIVNLIEFRCKVTTRWMMDNQQASAIIKARP